MSRPFLCRDVACVKGLKWEENWLPQKKVMKKTDVQSQIAHYSLSSVLCKSGNYRL